MQSEDSSMFIKTSKLKFGKILIDKLSYLTIAVLYNNIVGEILYSAMVTTEHVIITFLILISSNQKDGYHDLINIKEISIVLLNEKYQHVPFSFCVAFLTIQITMTALLIRIIINVKSFDSAKEIFICKKLYSLLVAVQRTLMCFITAICLGLNIQIALATQDSVRYLLCIFMTILGFSLFLLHSFLSFCIIQISIPNTQLSWASTQTQYTYVKETFKILLIIQEIYMPLLRETHIGHFLYFIFLIVTQTFLIIKGQTYFSNTINKTERFVKILTLGFTLTCSFRLVFISQLLEIAFFLPIIVYVCLKIFQKFEEYKEEKILLKLEQYGELNGLEFIKAIQYLSNAIERQNDADLGMLQRLQFQHRTQCFKDDCICKHYHQITIDSFKSYEETLAKQKLQKKQQEENFSDEYDESSGEVQFKDIPSKRHGNTNEISHLQLLEKEQAMKPNKKHQTFNQGLRVRFNLDDTTKHIDLDDKHPKITENRDSSANQMSDVISGFVDFTSFSQVQNMSNLVVNDLIIDDLYKETFQLENFNKQIYDFAQTQKNDPNHIEKLFKFQTQKEARKYFFIWLLESIFKELQQNYQFVSNLKNIQFQMIYINFINKSLQRHFLAVFQLLRITKNMKVQYGFFEKIQFQICEQLILQDALHHFKNSMGGFDISQFIQANHQLIKLDKLYESTTHDIIDFWKMWITENLTDLKNIIGLTRKISQCVNFIRKETKSLEQDQFISKDAAKYQLYILFHQEMLNDPLTSTSMQNYLKNSLMYRSNNKIFKNNRDPDDNQFDNHHYHSEQGICIVQAWGGENNSWDFLYGNKACADIVGCKESQIAGNNINLIMPAGLAEHHDDFIKRFYNEGHPRVLGKLRVLFIKNLKGFLVPISFRLNFYYHPKYSYSFIASLDKIRFMNLYMEESSKINTDDVMAFITDGDLNILDFSENVLKFLDMTIEQWKQFEEVSGKKMQIQNIVVGLDEIMGQEFGISLTPCNDYSALASKMVMYRKFSPEREVLSDDFQVQGILTYFQQVFPKSATEKVKAHTFIILPVHKHPDFDGVNSIAKQNKSQFVNAQHLNILNINSSGFVEATFDSSHQQITPVEISSMSSTSSQSDNNGYQANYTKGQLFLNKSPRILKLNLIIAIVTLSIFFVISIYNLIIFNEKYQSISGRQLAFHYLNQRNSNQRAALLSLKTLHQIAIEQKLNNQSIMPNITGGRYQQYINIMKDALIELRNYEILLDDFISTNQEYYTFKLDLSDVKFLSIDGDVFMDQMSFKHGIDLFGTYIDSIDTNELWKEKPSLNVSAYGTSVDKKIHSSYTQIERLLYFIYENGIYQMKENGQRQQLMIVQGSLGQTNESKLTLEITTIVSIAIISLILVIMFPTLIRIALRQFVIMQFFNSIDSKVIRNIHQNAILFQHKMRIYFGEIQYQEAELVDELKKQLDKSLKQQIEIENPVGKQEKDQFTIKPFKNESEKHESQIEYKHKENLEKKSSDKIKTRKLILEEVVFNDSKEMKKKKRNKKKEQFKDDSQRIQLHKKEDDHQKENDSPNSSDRTEEKENQIENKMELKLEMEEKARAKHIKSQIKKHYLKWKIKIAIGLLFCIGIFVAQLIVYFYQSQLVFGLDATATDSVSVFFRREQCTYNLFIFLREKIIKNSSLSLKVYTDPNNYYESAAINEVIAECQNIENQMYDFRKHLPDHLLLIQNQLDQFEGKQICNETFIRRHNDPISTQYCENAVGGIFGTGLGSVMQYIITFVQKKNMQFDAVTSQRTAKFLNEMLQNQEMLINIDLTLYYCREIYAAIQDVIQQGVLSYFNSKQSQYFLTAALFISFTAIIGLAFGIVIFKKVKQNILDIQNALILIPMDEIDNTLRQKIENFIAK